MPATGGTTTAEYLNADWEQVYEAEPEGDGMFEDHERDRYLSGAVTKIIEAYRKSHP